MTPSCCSFLSLILSIIIIIIIIIIIFTSYIAQ